MYAPNLLTRKILIKIKYAINKYTINQFLASSRGEQTQPSAPPQLPLSHSSPTSVATATCSNRVPHNISAGEKDAKTLL
jgi:hypothetical protein